MDSQPGSILNGVIPGCETIQLFFGGLYVLNVFSDNSGKSSTFRIVDSIGETPAVGNAFMDIFEYGESPACGVGGKLVSINNGRL